MSSELSQKPLTWHEELKHYISVMDNLEGVLVLMPEYRPDIYLAMAHHLGFEFLDYRKEMMAPLGWDAGTISLQELTWTLQGWKKNQPLVVANVEALLATKKESERRRWLRELVTEPWQRVIIVPLAVYNSEAPLTSASVLDMQDSDFPEQGLINRLAL